MQFMTLLLVCGMFALLALEVLDWLAGMTKPAIVFRGLRRLAEVRLPRPTRPDPADQGRTFSTPSCHFRVVAPDQVLFIGRNTLGSRPWVLKGRLVADGTTWLIESYGSVLLWVWSTYLVVFWIVATWGAYLADGLVAACVVFGVGTLGSLIYRRWYSAQVARTEELADEIARALVERTEASTDATT